MSASLRPPAANLDLDALKQRQQATWASGNYAIVGTTLQIVGEVLCESLDLRAGSRVLDVAAGNGNATLAAARRFCDVTSTDYVASLLESGKTRARAEGMDVRFEHADAEALPYGDGSFDAVLSTFGVMFTPNHALAANELMRVCRSGGKIGLANWTPDSFIGAVFKLIGRYLPPAQGTQPPARWGTAQYVEELFDGGCRFVRTDRYHFTFRYRSLQHWIDVFRTYYGPINKAYAALECEQQQALTDDLMALLSEHNRSGDHTLVIPSAYLSVVAERA